MRARRLVAAAVLAAALTPAPRASAFCGFYVSGSNQQVFNNATQVALMREGTRTVMSIENNYQGPPEQFAMVVPVPVVLQKENVRTLPRALFDKLDELDAPRLVEYWEQDPCTPPYPEEEAARGITTTAMPSAVMPKGSLGVKVEAQFVVGEYEIVILSAQDSTGLDTWLRREKYNIPEGAEPVLRPYVQAGMRFFVAKVDPQKVTFKDGMATLSPLRFHYDAETFSLPVRLGLLNSKGTQDLVVHILAKGQRYEVANYPNVAIPTNLNVEQDAKKTFGAFYAALFDRTVAKNPRAVVTEYSWDASTCDPCPGPALDGSDFATLGADVMPGAGQDSYYAYGGGYVLTRLHARYGKDTLGQDLVFRVAPPIVGGRESYVRPNELEHGASPSSTNNFQGRYAIRHPWTGPIACEHPVRGVWGGPPGGAEQKPAAARDLAFAPRGGVQLARFIDQDVPEIGLRHGILEPLTPPPAPAPRADTAKPAPTAARASGCDSCDTTGTGGAGDALAAIAVAALALVFVRRRR